MRVCLDFDGVIHDAAHPVPGRRMGPPIEGALGAILLLTDQGHQVFIHTARVVVADDADHVVEWLRYYGFPGTLAIYTQKPLADCYIDDRGLHFKDWATSLAELEEVAQRGFGTYTRRAQPSGAQPRAHRRDRQPGARLPSTRLGGQSDGGGA